MQGIKKDIELQNEINRLQASGAGGGTVTYAVQDLTLEGTDDTTTAVAAYGINLVKVATTSDLATRLPIASTGKQVIFINTSTLPILVFPSAVGGTINGVVNGYATIPNDGVSYSFYCTENPLPGAWTWAPPAVGQIQLPTISISHTNGVQTESWGVGNVGAQLINPPGPNWYNDINIVGFPTASGGTQITFTPGPDYWATTNFNPARTLITTKVYSNFLPGDSPTPTQVPTIGRYVAYSNGSGFNNYTASQVRLSTLFGGQTVVAGPTNTPSEIGDVDTLYCIQPANLVQVPPAENDAIGIGPDGNYYYTFRINIPFTAATKVYEFDIFLEHD
ncbi:hypothetical protein H8D85_02690 [bacterium]|nr:hypothetical protein [bacterium]